MRPPSDFGKTTKSAMGMATRSPAEGDEIRNIWVEGSDVLYEVVVDNIARIRVDSAFHQSRQAEKRCRYLQEAYNVGADQS